MAERATDSVEQGGAVLVEAVCGAGAGGEQRRAKAAKFTTSDDMSDAVPVGLPEGSSRFVASSGEPLSMHPGTAERSLGKISLATPCSTL
jgi:hypothetical protein